MTAPTRDVLQNHIVPTLASFPGERGLRLSEAKTRIVPVDDGVDFLGFTVRRFRGKVLTRPQKAKVVRHLRTIADYLRQHRQASPSQVIAALGPVIRGWTAYYRHGASKRTFHTADHHIVGKLWRWAERRHPTKSATWVRSRYFDQGWNLVDGKARLARHDEVAIVRHAKVEGKRSPLNPDDRAYRDARRHRRLDEAMRSRKRAALLRLQDYRCAMCGVRFDPEDDMAFIEAHHDTPRHRGGTDRITNLRLVHRWCHKAHHTRTVHQAAEA